MIPLKAETPVFSAPFVTWGLIVVNALVFLWMHSQGPLGFQRAVIEYAAIPQNIVGSDISILMHQDQMIAAVVGEAEVVAYPGVDVRRIVFQGSHYFYPDRYGRPRRLDVVRQEIHPWLTLLTSMFMHAGWMHLIGNMWFLFVFGPSLEDLLGKLSYLVLYFAAGLGATAAQLIHDPDSLIPFLGASGAIAGVMGAFAVRFPGANVLTIVPILIYTLAHLPAWIFMLIYIGEQIFMSIVHFEENGGVAWFAHIGGFAAGYALVRFLPVRGPWREILARRRERSFIP